MSDQDETILDNMDADLTATVLEDTTPSTTEEPSVASTTDPYTEMLKSIKTEDGRVKYATVSDAINSIPHKESHIAKLEAELQELREAQQKSHTVDDILETVTANRSGQADQPRKELTEQDLAGLVNNVLERKRKQELAKDNLVQVTKALKEKYGDKAKESYLSKAEELNMSVKELNRLALTSPQAFFKLTGIEGNTKQSKSSYSNASLNMDAAETNRSGETPRVNRPVVGATMHDMIGEWRAAKSEANKQLGIE